MDLEKIGSSGWIRTSNPPVNRLIQIFGLAGSAAGSSDGILLLPGVRRKFARLARCCVGSTKPRFERLHARTVCRCGINRPLRQLFRRRTLGSRSTSRLPTESWSATMTLKITLGVLGARLRRRSPPRLPPMRLASDAKRNRRSAVERVDLTRELAAACAATSRGGSSPRSSRMRWIPEAERQTARLHGITKGSPPVRTNFSSNRMSFRRLTAGSLPISEGWNQAPQVAGRAAVPRARH
jgi:hypothetical protein